MIENSRPPAGEDGDLRALAALDPPARDALRRVLVHDLLDFLKIHKEERPKALRLLTEIDAAR